MISIRTSNFTFILSFMFCTFKSTFLNPYENLLGIQSNQIAAHLCTNAIKLVTKHTKYTMTVADKSMADVSPVKTVNYASWYSFLWKMLLWNLEHKNQF